MGLTVSELLSRCSSSELSEWLAFYSVEPFGELRADFRSAVVACTIANSNRGKGKAYKPNDFMPNFEEKKPMTGDEIKSVLMGVSNGSSR